MSRIRNAILDFIPASLRNGLRLAKEYHRLWRLLPFQEAFPIVFNRFCYGWVSSPKKREILNDRKHSMMEEALLRHAFSGFSFETEAVHPLGDTDPGSLPIWVCWLQGEDALPELNRVCVKSIRKYAGSHPVHFLTDESIPSWIDIPESILASYRSGRIRPVFFSDYVRCAFLARYGGVWLDSTILQTDALCPAWFTAPWMSVKIHPADNESVSRYRWTGFAIGGMPGSPFFKKICEMFERYFKHFDTNLDYLLIDYFFDLLANQDKKSAEWVAAVPVSHPDIHTLRSLMNEPFDSGQYHRMLAGTSLYKLTYKTTLLPLVAGDVTYWGYLLDQSRND